MAKKKSKPSAAQTKRKAAKKMRPTAKKKSAGKTAATAVNRAGKKASKKSGKKKSSLKRPASDNSKPSQSRPSHAGLPKQLNSPGFAGKPKKLERDCFPESASPKDFKCFGPAATEDGELEHARICDLGCFTQDGKDSNKYYHGAVVQHRKSKNWYVYFEWGRTGGTSCSFQFVACACEEDARAYFAKQLHTKNDKRGEWVTVAGIRTLRAKKGKDCYLVRPMAKRTTGLPDARKLTHARSAKKAKSVRSQPDGDPKTLKLLRDLHLATIAYTRKSMADSSVPTQRAINEARKFLAEAQGHVADLGDDLEAQVSNKKLRRLTELMFSRIPRKKKVGADPSTWMLTGNNIVDWHDDLDAFESAIRSIEIEMNPSFDLLGDMKLEMDWIDPKSDVGQFLHGWCPDASAHRHEKIDQMLIENIWSIKQTWTKNRLQKTQKRILKACKKPGHKAMFQPKTRLDLDSSDRKQYVASNTALLFHGTRGVNVSAILREALRMPDTLVAVALTGAKFGPGIYFSDDWKKSANYTNAKGSTEAGKRGSVKRRQAFLFLADVVLGRPHLAPGHHGFTKPPRGYHSVFGKAGHSDVDDNEFIVFKAEQCELRYLIEFKSS